MRPGAAGPPGAGAPPPAGWGSGFRSLHHPQVRTREKGCDPAQHGGSSEVCSTNQVEQEDCRNPCCECASGLVVKPLIYKVKWMAGGAPGGPGKPAPRPVPPGFREGAGPVATATQPALETRVVAPMISQECATLSTAVSDLLCQALKFSEE